jgi:hypothetical protein
MKEHWEYLIGIAALIGALWGQIKSVLNSLGNLIVVTVETDSDLTRAILALLRAKRRRSVDGTYYMDKLPIKAERINRWVPYKDGQAATGFYWHIHGFVKYSTEIEKSNNHSTMKYKFSFIRGSVDWFALVDTAARAFNGVAVGATFETYRHKIVYHHGSSYSAMTNRDVEDLGKDKLRVRWSTDSLCTLIGRQPLEIGDWGAGSDSYVLPKALGYVSHEVATWAKSQDWYERRGLAWQRGLLLDGEAGTGKTSYARSEAVKHDWPVHVMDLARLSNQELREAWREAAESVPCMILIEDIERVFDGDVNVAAASRGITGGALTFDTLLNTISGIEQHAGVFLVVTTNHLDKIDPALRRKGRLDRVVKFPKLEREDALQIAENILESKLVAHRIVTELGDCTAADLQEACCRIALEELFRLEQEAPQEIPALAREAGNHSPPNGAK